MVVVRWEGVLKIRFLAVISFLFFSGSYEAAQADIYRHIDKDGVVHFTNVPTKGDYSWVMPEKREVSYISPVGGSEIYRYAGIIEKASEKHGVDPMLVRAIIKAESDFDPYAVSEDGATGLMQLMPETARLMGVSNIMDPAQNIEGGVKYLRRLLTQFNWNIKYALAAYNAGENSVLKYAGIPPYPETVEYVRRVLGYYNGNSRVISRQ
ncbi:MAG: lytic transglycosylase domain-containing protein [Deltaproteobacteria bacterium]|nr:lytic transglycosylase domain-containing protein [Deltaproteobacteria bacterium]